ncbi:hypothetical protein [Clostridium beijerinckii]|jgi:hypothetical protein|uniref:Uncharacterized protein n=2 Tax=Clostridium beijerinckii TaxID=1520 RepID=A0A1W7LL08_CLOBE|nr:hypothetical protein [Clostridium beijerinckii]ABR33839.1 conserved hypothetical protein [Clostridium beijerinckii NCIMB 8052]AIU01011.1 hypothetical protein Cbs_1665 [Clostridium beijerinckii ATCC 35702]MBA8937282.1 hypothetical protein [Clostridium beijerinckii]MBF7812264.1 hypothetical protein [Clostridium beijerinckii]NRT24874.1 hypothetical protein [Clostridium beijerinckii]
MIRTALKLIIKVLESKLIKSGIEEKILKNKNYVTVGKAIWNIVDENFRISKTVEEKVLSKADQFDKLLLAKFPELSQDDVSEIRQTIAGEINQGKAAVVDNSTLIKQLQDDNTNLKAELAALTEQFNKVQELLVKPTDVSTQQVTA